MQLSDDNPKKYLIATINHSHAGFFAYVNFAINQIIYAEEKCLSPVVFFGPKSGDGPNAFYQEDMGDNIWDYYFEPVSGLTYDDIQRKLKDPKDSLSQGDLVHLTSEQLWELHTSNPGSVYPYPHGIHFHTYTSDPQWYEKQRDRGSHLVQKYITPKHHIIQKVNAFVEANFGSAGVLGIHMRGTDKGSAHSPRKLMRVVHPHEYFPFIDDYLSGQANAKIFVATDQQQFADKIRARYPDRTLTYEAVRATGIRNPFEVSDGKAYRKGEDVLIDCLLLSRCDFLLKCTSAVGEFAVYFNPQLRCIDLNHASDDLTPTQKLKIWLKHKAYKHYLKWKQSTQQSGHLGRRRKKRGRAADVIDAVLGGRKVDPGAYFLDLQCRSGLGDRLLDVWAGLAVARLHDPNAKVLLRWHDGKKFQGFVAQYDPRLFSIAGCEFTSRAARGGIETKSVFSHSELNRDAGIHDLESGGKQIVLLHGNIWGNNTPERLIESRDTYQLRHDVRQADADAEFLAAAKSTTPSGRVLQAIPVDISDRIGLHVRLTDKLQKDEADFDMNIETWRMVEKRVLALVDQCISRRLPMFICSDDQEYKSKLLGKIRKQGGDVVDAFEIEQNQRFQGYNAAVDFFALSRCKAIVQMTKYSTFSMAAAMIGGVPLLNATIACSTTGNRIDQWRGVIEKLYALDNSNDVLDQVLLGDRSVTMPQ
ncbi:MAG: hypothetical protein AAGB04_02165 [Pseudomonadota bacterium]